MDRVSIMGIPIDRLTMTEALALIEKFIREKSSHHIVTADASMVVLAHENPDLMAIIQSAELITPDGAGLLWASRMLNKPIESRVSGVDIVARVCELSAKTSISVYLLGSAPGVVDAASLRLSEQYPGLRIAGKHHGYYNPDEEEEVVHEIAEARPDVLFVAFGIPKQELFIRNYREILNVPVSIGVGGSFDVYSGRVNRAPIWMQNMGFEWFYRLLQNPKKFSKVKLLPKFVFMAIWTKITGQS